MSTFVDVTLHSAQWFYLSRRGGTGEDGWSHLQGDMHMLAVVSLVPRLSPRANLYRFSVLQATESWAGPGNEARLLWLSVEMPWLALGGPILALFAQIGLENTALTL